MADGFSCREQILQTTQRRALHPAEVMKMALDDRGYTRDDAYPESRFVPDITERKRRIVIRGYAVLAALVIAAVAATTDLARAIDGTSENRALQVWI